MEKRTKAGIAFALAATALFLACLASLPVIAREFLFGGTRTERIVSASFVTGGSKTAKLVLFEEDRLENIEFTKPLDGFNWIVFSKEAKVSVLVPFRVSYFADLRSPSTRFAYNPFRDVLEVSVPGLEPMPPSIFTDRIISQIHKKSALIDENAAIEELKSRLYPILEGNAKTWAREERVRNEAEASLEAAIRKILIEASGRAPSVITVKISRD